MLIVFFSVHCVICVFLQYFDTVGWVIRPVKTVARTTYTVLVETLNHAQSINQLLMLSWQMWCTVWNTVANESQSHVAWRKQWSCYEHTAGSKLTVNNSAFAKISMMQFDKRRLNSSANHTVSSLISF